MSEESDILEFDMGNNPTKNIIFVTIRIYSDKPILYDIESFALLISASDRFIEIPPFFLEFISCIIKGTGKCRIDIDFEIEHGIGKSISHDWEVDLKDSLHTE